MVANVSVTLEDTSANVKITSLEGTAQVLYYGAKVFAFLLVVSMTGNVCYSVKNDFKIF